MEAAFGGLMAVGGMMTMISSVYYWIMVCVRERGGRKTPFQTIVISFLLACEVGTILSSFMSFGFSSESDTSTLLCSFGEGIFYFFSCSSFFLSSLLVFSLLHLCFVGNNSSTPGFILPPSPPTKKALVTSLLFELMAVISCVVLILISDEMNPCIKSQLTRGYYWGVWGITTLFNFSSLLAILYKVHKITRKMSKDRKALRSVAAVAIVIGVLRFPAFLQILITVRNPRDLLAEGSTAIAVLVLIAFFLNVTQGFFIVVFVGINQGIFNWCCCCCGGKGFGDTSTPPPSSYVPSTTRGSQTLDQRRNVDDFKQEEIVLD